MEHDGQVTRSHPPLYYHVCPNEHTVKEYKRYPLIKHVEEPTYADLQGMRDKLLDEMPNIKCVVCGKDSGLKICTTNRAKLFSEGGWWQRAGTYELTCPECMKKREDKTDEL